jgi:hypothetical protein
MYQVPDAISTLQQQHLVQAVVIADMLQVEHVAQQALQALSIAAGAPQGLAAETLRALASLEAWPAGLKQLLPSLVKNSACCRDSTAAIKAADAGGSVQNMLVGALGDLQGVWSSAEEKALLLVLPLPAMQLLLSSDLVRVPSEDTVLYTAAQYVRAQTQPAHKAAAKAALALLIRVLQLSAFAQCWAALPAGSSQHLLSTYVQQVRDLLYLNAIAPLGESEVPAPVGAPSSWRLGARQIRPLGDGVQLSWRVTVEQLQQACKDSSAQQKVVFISSPGSPPMGGVAWRMRIGCQQRKGGTVVGLFVGPVAGDLPAGSFYKLDCTVMWQGVERTQSSPCMNFFGIPQLL